ncbi:MAG TPA: hypothetical protein DCR93_09175, partial [Cytophagales bacterium]|nr:hypothetical protein [Cytophagales bacterium]
QVRAVAYSRSGLASPSDPLGGVIDRAVPHIAGAPHPTDGVYHTGDEVFFNFSEPIDCDIWPTESWETYVIPYGTNDTIALDVHVACTGMRTYGVYKEEQLAQYFGGTVYIVLTDLLDMAGNPAESNITHQFQIGSIGEETSPVSLLTPENNWLMNRANPKVTLTAGDYDVFEVEYTLDSLVWEYRATHQAEWDTLATADSAAIIAEYQARQGEQNGQPFFAKDWTPNVPDGDYEVRV